MKALRVVVLLQGQCDNAAEACVGILNTVFILAVLFLISFSYHPYSKSSKSVIAELKEKCAFTLLLLLRVRC